ncbi:carbonic anhydrase [Streptomyces microflavus]|uniref:carbonic anhydrase n=1 Tax=Streptomyces microflavus TaxID=1919 RepID=UPI0037FBE699
MTEFRRTKSIASVFRRVRKVPSGMRPLMTSRNRHARAAQTRTDAQPTLPETMHQALFITCSDAHVTPTKVASLHPEQLFELRNIGNVVPPYQPNVVSGEIATIEHILSERNIRDVVVFGHSQCGAVAALLDRSTVSVSPAMRRWIVVARSRKASQEAAGALAEGALEAEAWDRAARAHLLTQFSHLTGYPGIQRLRAKQLRVHAWFGSAASSGVESYQPREGSFRPLIPKQRRQT